MDDFTLARIVHATAILFWIGGVGFVTLVVMPAVRAGYPEHERLAAFHRIEARFAPQARIWVLLAGTSGLWMSWRGGLWARFADAQFWWMHAMVAIWLVFAAMLFVVEPLFLHRRMTRSPHPHKDFARMQRMHHILLALSVLTLIGAIGGSHGLF
ncbi:hypothetical protein [Sphingomonas colocasiae]|uniref:DUF4149 domain-containing protein n=1 Tax=Sphingomonas colocasiae TaxID=1848973 RepID=A0ABS7PYH8_9SPHN|nr:hypothetical protein [Sphingomonas colocasiae]MBY8826417.1 hypothetical protein [Sphingomonas colocasiae]